MFRCLRQHPQRLRLLEEVGLVMSSITEAGAVAAAGESCTQALRLHAAAARSYTQLACQQATGNGPRQLLQPAPALARGFASAAGGPASRPPVNYISLALTLGTGGALLAFYKYQKDKKIEELRNKEAVAVGGAAIGGPFELVDTAGRPFTDRDLLGKWALLYFGFTHCPDICPDELEKVAAAVDSVEKQCGERIVPVFISIDPERDSVPQVAAYVKEFHPRMIGLTGPPEKTHAAAKAYRVYYSKTNESSDDYLVDHSIITYLVNPEGQFVTFYGKNYEAQQLADSLKAYVESWRKEHPTQA